MKKTTSNPESNTLRVLILEDNPADAELIVRELRRAKIQCATRLTSGKREFVSALLEFGPQVILSDFKLPEFDGLAALEMARQQAPETPFIFVSGSIGEEKAIESLAHGASDYIFKDNLQRLGPAVRRVVADAELRLQKKKTDEELNRHVEQLRLLAEAADRFVHINNLEKAFQYLSRTICGISEAPYLLLSQYDEKMQALRPGIAIGFEPFAKALRQRLGSDLMLKSFYLRDMSPEVFSDFISRRLLPVRNGLFGFFNEKTSLQDCRAIEKLLAINAIFNMGFSWENQLFGAVTLFFKKDGELKNAGQVEALVNLAAVAIKRLQAEESLRESEEKYRTLVIQSPDGIFIIDLQGNFISINQSMCAGLGYSEAEFLAMNFRDIVPEKFLDLHLRRLTEIMKGNSQNEAAEYEVRARNGEIHCIAILSAPYYKDNKLIGFQGFARDITEKKKMEIRLRESEEYYRTLVETSPDAIMIVDADGRVTFASSKTYDLFGIPAKISINGTSIMDFIEPGEIPRMQGRMVEILSKNSLPRISVYRLMKHDRQPFWGEVSSSPIRDVQKRNSSLLLVLRDISKRKHAEEELQLSAEKWQSTFNSITDIVSVISLDHTFLEINQAGCDAMGLKHGDIIGKKCCELVHNLANPLAGCPCSATIQSKKMEMREIFENGRYYQLTAWPILNAKGELLAFSHTVKDISERKQAEEQIQASLKEKEVLLQEIHHRVKNNLQIVSGLLTLQAEQSAGKSLDEIFRESQDRIRSIALIHEKLYQSRNLAEIAFDEYLRALVDNLCLSYGIAAGRITIQYALEPILFSIEKAIPLGLIVNELVTNILKHAFPAGQQGEIRIGLHGYMGAKSYALKTNSGTLHIVPTCELIVADTGVGLPADQIPGQQKSLGMNLVFMLARQIKAELKIKTGPGTEFRFLFPGLPGNHDNEKNAHGG